MKEVKVPKAWLEAGVKKAQTQAEPKQVTARIDMSAEVAGQGKCPDCKQPMERAMAAGVDCYVCVPDRIAIPVPDDLAQDVPE